jgi:hypothetical protein
MCMFKITIRSFLDSQLLSILAVKCHLKGAILIDNQIRKLHQDKDKKPQRLFFVILKH